MEMRDVYQGITDNVTLFGLPPEYIPFPALDPGMPNAFEQLLQGALEKTRIAADKEDRALEQNRSYESDMASFERELTQVKNTYEDRLAQICGTFRTEDGRVFPAIAKYADLTPTTQLFGDPCGFMGNGEIYQALGQVESSGLEVDRLIEMHGQILERVEIERQRARSQCGVIRQQANLEFRLGNQVSSIEEEIENIQEEMERKKKKRSAWKGLLVGVAGAAIAGGLTGGTAFGVALVAGIKENPMKMIKGVAGLYSAYSSKTSKGEQEIDRKRQEINDLTLSTNRAITLLGCDQVKIDSWARIKETLLELKLNALSLTEVDYKIQLEVAQVSALKNEATRLANEQAEAEQLAINVEAARNDPNT
ncbi:MAG: hypothetical protein FJY85_22900, partial [Deltaproteobacteria bacterium]|nr:hypothetical protein [Deltaproteobacteria bacterium]